MQMPIKDAVRILRRLQEPEAYEPQITQDAFDALEMAIKTLEQPEIIRCRNCCWWTKMEDSLQGRCALSGSYPTGAWYCGNARRKDGT